MLKFQSQVYRISDIIGWNERKELILSPNFQRRHVWSPRGKSYLIDSIIRGMPLPQFFIREMVITRERKTVREVVDGQQRIRTILEFLNDTFTVLPMHSEAFSGMKFSQLPEEVQASFFSFPLSVNVLEGAQDSDVLEIFSRINAYSVPLNSQEKLNAEYIGVFKKKMDALSKVHLEYWQRNKILSSQAIARMKEVELTVELISAMLEGLQNGKKIIKVMYERYDDDFPQAAYLESRFADVLTLAEQLLSNNVLNMEFRRSPLFYSIFCAIYDSKYGFRSTAESGVKVLKENELNQVQQKLCDLNEALIGQRNDPMYHEFIAVSKSSTDKIRSRQHRHDYLSRIISPCFANA